MANRVLFGSKSGLGFGLYVSPPGQDVLTIADSDLLFGSNSPAFQLVQTGTVTLSTTPTTITIPNLGFKPVVIFHNPQFLKTVDYTVDCRRVAITYPTTTSLQMRVAIYNDGTELNQVNTHQWVTTSFTTQYAIARLNADG